MKKEEREVGFEIDVPRQLTLYRGGGVLLSI